MLILQITTIICSQIISCQIVQAGIFKSTSKSLWKGNLEIPELLGSQGGQVPAVFSHPEMELQGPWVRRSPGWWSTG